MLKRPNNKLIKRRLCVPWKLRWLIYILLLIALFYGVENSRGYLAIRHYKKICSDRGEWFDEASRIQTRPKDDIPLHSLPGVRSLFNSDNLQQEIAGFNPKSVRQLYLGYRTSSSYPFNMALTDSDDLNYQQAAALYLELSADRDRQLNPLFKALDQASSAYQKLDKLNSDTKFICLQHLAKILKTRATANIQAGNTDAGLIDIQRLFKFSNLICNEDILLPVLIGNSSARSSLDPIWEGLERQVWNDQQLASLSDLLLQVDVSELPSKVFLGERAYGYNQYKKSLSTPVKRWKTISEQQKMWGKLTQAIGGHPSKPSFEDQMGDLIGKLTAFVEPDGWYALAFVKQMETTRATLSPTSKAVDLPVYFSIWGNYEAGSIDYINHKFTLTQTSIQLTVLAIANERYFLRYNDYPKTLSELAPEFLNSVPKDPYTGSSFVYLPAGKRSDRPVIYSIGENGIDDGGYPCRDSRRAGDLVWQYRLPDNFTLENFKFDEIPK